MAKPINAPKQFQDILFPTAGIDVSGPFSQQRKGTTPVGVNVRAFEASTNRQRGGSRPGISKYASNQVYGSNHVQEITGVITTSGTIPGSTTAGGALALYYLTPIPNPTVLHRSNGTTDLWTYAHDNGAGGNRIAGYGNTVAQIDRVGAGTDAAGQVITNGVLAATITYADTIDYRATTVAAGFGYCYFAYQKSSLLKIISYHIDTGTTVTATSASWPLNGWSFSGIIKVGNGAYTDRLFIGSNHASDGILQVKAPALDTSLTYTVVSRSNINAQVSGYSFRGEGLFAQAGDVLAIPVGITASNLAGLVFYNMASSAFVYTAISGITSFSGLCGITTDGTDFYFGVLPTSSTGVVRKYSGTTGALQWTSSSFSIPLTDGMLVELAYTA